MTGMDAAVIVPIAVGLFMLVLGMLCWRGPWRRTPWRNWPEREAKTRVPILPTALLGGPWVVLLGVGNALPTDSVAFNAVLAVTMVSMVTSLVFFFWDPPWFGPRWYREFRRAFDRGGTPEWLAEDARRPGESSVEATHRHMTSWRPVPPFHDARLLVDPDGPRNAPHGHRGFLSYYPHAPGFHGKGSPSTNEVIPVEALTGASELRPGAGLDGVMRRDGLRSRLVPRMRVDTAEGPWLFQVRKAEEAVKEIRRRYLDPTTNLYGMPPRREAERQAAGDTSVAR